MSGRGSVEIADLALIVAQTATVGLRLAVTQEAGEWQVRRGEIILDAPAQLPSQRWVYSEYLFIDEQVPGALAGALLGGRAQSVAGYKIAVPEPAASNALWERIAGQRRFGSVVTAWPRTEWRISGQQVPTRQDGLLIGDGPSFLGYAAACSSFSTRPRRITGDTAICGASSGTSGKLGCTESRSGQLVWSLMSVVPIYPDCDSR